MFLEVMKEASKSYRPASSYISDILSLKTGHLLCDHFVEEKETANMMELQRDFKQHIRTFILSQKLKGHFMCKIFFDFVVRIYSVCACRA